MSQGSSELFHSNFLAFIADKYPVFFLAVMKALHEEFPNYISVGREISHTDISFYDVDIKEYKKQHKGKLPPPVFIIENKMKSLPYAEQLEKYLDKLFPKIDEKVRRRKIMLLVPYSAPLEIVNDYTVLSYDKLGEKMKTHLSLIDEGFTHELIARYSEFIINLNKAIDHIAKPDLNKTTVGDYFNREVEPMSRFTDLRLASIAWKLRMSYLVEELCTRFKNTDFAIVRSYKEFNEEPKDNNYFKRLLINVSYANNKPITECLVHLDEEIDFIVQLDNGVYNQGIIIKTTEGELIKLNKTKDAKDLAKRNLINSLPTGTAKDLVKELKICEDKPLSYDNFFYQHVNNIGQKTLNNALDQMVNEVKDIYSRYNKNHK